MAGVKHIAFCHDVTSVCVYVTFVTRFVYLQVSVQIYVYVSLAANNFLYLLGKKVETLYDTYLHQDLLMYGTVAPGSCLWAGLGVKICNRSPRKHTKSD